MRSNLKFLYLFYRYFGCFSFDLTEWYCQFQQTDWKLLVNVTSHILYDFADSKAKKKYMCVYGHPTHPIFQPPTLTFFIGNYSALIFASDPINFYTEFG